MSNNNNAGTHVCPTDGRRFQTRAALQQHRAAVHGAPQPQRAIRNRRRGGVLPRETALGAAPAAVRSTAKPTSSNQRVPFSTSMERIRTVDLPADTKTGKEIARVIINANCTPRLSMMASAFQRVTYTSVKLHVSAKGSSGVGGGYLVAFVADVTDEPDLNQLGSFEGARTRKFWEDTEVVGTPSNDKYYTSPEDTSEGDRWWSPGKFIVLVDGKPSSAVGLTFHLSITCHLSGTSIERPLPPGASASVVLKNLFFKEGNHTMEDDQKVQDPKQLISPLPDSITTPLIFKVPTFILEYSEGTGDTGTIAFQYLYVTQTHIGASLDGKTNFVAKNQQAGVIRSVTVPKGQLVIPHTESDLKRISFFSQYEAIPFPK